MPEGGAGAFGGSYRRSPAKSGEEVWCIYLGHIRGRGVVYGFLVLTRISMTHTRSLAYTFTSHFEFVSHPHITRSPLPSKHKHFATHERAIHTFVSAVLRLVHAVPEAMASIAPWVVYAACFDDLRCALLKVCCTTYLAFVVFINVVILATLGMLLNLSSMHSTHVLVMPLCSTYVAQSI